MSLSAIMFSSMQLPATLPQARGAVWGCCDPSAGPGTWSCCSSSHWPQPTDQPVHIPLWGLPTLTQIDSVSSSRSSIKILNRSTPNSNPWGAPLVTTTSWMDLHPPPRSGPRSPAVFFPSEVHICLSHRLQLPQQHAMGDGVGGFVIWVGHIHTLIHQVVTWS